ncbi:T9SS type A sorting domain-containing protein [Hymenobacter cellulosilyticus]|uniref:T9SS type A sorting domain-containing protein n=1 Tax=Hymenobacter cellulosilyticus TaxID=2932248 RepID=A0A8T9Q256_9BACT|nr:T9SS type A sorting domain-containing protein [Hymenobacter cellulosilyticus]UOQ71507.1 T9SS type A sorting domain-containing protein [Hymenobacter cellulosilyticus]
MTPNPSAGKLAVQFTLRQSEAYTLALYDLQGRLVKTVASGMAAGTQVIPVQAGEYPAGVYLLRLTTGKQVLTQRLVLSR